MTDKLKPCPFCGGKAHLLEMKSTVKQRYIVTCNNADCIMSKLKSPFVIKYLSIAEAKRKWNRRADNAR